MTIEEKKQVEIERRRAVKEAWKREVGLVNQGKGTVDWTPQQQRELIEKGHVSGYEGHHMKSVNEYPEHAGNVNNIQLLNHNDHVKAHKAGKVNEKDGFHSMTNGYYDTKSEKMHSFGDEPPKEPKSSKLSHPIYKESAKANDKVNDNGKTNNKTTGQYKTNNRTTSQNKTNNKATSQARTNGKQVDSFSKNASNHAKQSTGNERGK